ncbi:unnamed protein product [Linum trigynum]|uniref:Uncharacterized protein n=1 Tax=Linum trigynum TaxID=586398 RepID=A0AAV2CE20_9ROSI
MLRCASHFLEMTEEFADKNLVSRAVVQVAAIGSCKTLTPAVRSKDSSHSIGYQLGSGRSRSTETCKRGRSFFVVVPIDESSNGWQGKSLKSLFWEPAAV